MEESKLGLLSLTWSNHSSALIQNLVNSRFKETFCDATVICEDKHILVHKFVLSSCSEYFEEIFRKTPCRHPFIILKDTALVELEALLDYMYKGRANILEDHLSELIKAADLFKVKGLSVSDDDISPIILSPKVSKVCLSSNVDLPMACNDVSNTEFGDDTVNESEELGVSSSKRKSDSSVTEGKKINTSSKQAKRRKVQEKKKKIKNKKTKTSGILSNKKNQSCLGEPVVVLERNLNLKDRQFVLEGVSSDFNNDIKEEKEYLYYPNDSFEGTLPKKNCETVHNMENHELYSPSNSPPPHSSSVISEGYNCSNLNEGSNENRKTNNGDRIDVEMNMENGDQKHNFLKTCETVVPTNKNFPHEISNIEGCETDSVREDKPLKCTVCSYRAKQPSHLVAHLRTHSATKPFKCSLCLYCTNSKVRLLTHAKAHTGGKPYQCSKCPYRAALKFNMEKHEKNCEGKTISQPYRCSICPYNTAKNSALERHMKAHAGKKHFVCAFCTHKTTRKSLLRDHVISKHGKDLKVV